MKKFIMSLIGLVAMGLGALFFGATLTGCAGFYWPEHFDTVTKVEQSRAEADKEYYITLRQIFISGTPEAQMLAANNLGINRAIQRHTPIETPKESPAVTSLVSGLVNVATLGIGMWGIKEIVGAVERSNYVEIAADRGSNITYGPGTGYSATATPTVVSPEVYFLPGE